jgi:phosphatidylglycerol:prolipoprotein diacylglycerol transferase
MYGFCPAGDVPRHPSQLYEAGLEGVALFLILWLAVWKWRAADQARLCHRPVPVRLRPHPAPRWRISASPTSAWKTCRWGLTMGMMLSIPMMILGAWLIWRAWSRPPVAA